MRRAVLLLIIAIALVAASVAGAATSSPPRGDLSSAEYKEFVAVQKDEKKKPTSRNLAVIARQTCRALTDISRLTTAQHAECEASLIYAYEFYAFPYAVAQCAKLSTTTTQTKCDLVSATGFEAAVRVFILTNAASLRAVKPRHFSRRCLDYLVFTRPQARTTKRLLAGLKRYLSALHGGNATSVAAADTRLDSDLVSSKQAMSLNITVSVCPHE